MFKYRILLIILVLLFQSACSSMQSSTANYDPFEPTNRVVYELNNVVDESLLQPMAKTYLVLPSIIRSGFRNFFANLEDVTTLFNEILQLKFAQAISDLIRIVTNSTLGLAGILDVATSMDLPKHKESFADTLGYWGVESGPYLVLPLFGPSSLRDAPAVVVDSLTNPLTYLDPTNHRNIATGTRIIAKRADLMKTTQISDELALDVYQFMRDSYLQWRKNEVFDGDVPLEVDDSLFETEDSFIE